MNYRISSRVTGHYGTEVLIRAYQRSSGALLGETVVTEGTYNIDVASGEECYLVLLPLIGDCWRTGRLHYLGDVVYPTDYHSVPFYFKCTGAGVVGQYEPAFTVQPLQTISDGECRWERVERLPFPMIHYPVTPILI